MEQAVCLVEEDMEKFLEGGELLLTSFVVYKKLGESRLKWGEISRFNLY